MFQRLLVSTTALALVAFATTAWAQVNPSGNTLVSLGGPSIVNPDDPMPVAGASSISGNVTTQDNRPLKDARIEIRDITSGAMISYGYTQSSGTFLLRNVRPGNYEVVATSGLLEAREEVHLDATPAEVRLRMPFTGVQQAPSGQQTVSVQALATPDKARDALQKARRAADKGKTDVARHEIDNALKIDPHYSEAIVARGILEMQSGDLNAAGNDFQKAIDFDNNNAVAYTAMASIYNLRRQFPDALRELDRAVALTPTAWQVHYEYAKAHLGQGDFTTALNEIDRAQRFAGKDFSPLHVVKGQALLGIKAFPQAIMEFQKYLDLEKDGPGTARVQQLIAQARESAASSK